MTDVIRTEGLTKRYGPLTAVSNVDLRVDEGDLYGFLGPNGSGKSTTLRMLLGLVFATAGHVEVLGRPMPSSAHTVLPSVGAIIEGPGFYAHLSGRRNLMLIDASRRDGSAADRRRRVGEALERAGLGDVGRRAFKTYSSGMKQRLALAAALLRRPRLLVLDEPMNGLDPQGAREVRQLLTDLTAGGTTVLFSTHLLTEVEQICNRSGIMNQGRLIAQDRVERLLQPTGRVRVTTPDRALVPAAIGRLGQAQLDGAGPNGVVVELDGSTPEDLNRVLVEGGVRVQELIVERQRLEDLFLGLTANGGPSRTRGCGDAAR